MESTNGVEHEAVDSLAGGEHHHGGAAVEGVACCHKVPARLQGVCLRGFIICGLRDTVQTNVKILSSFQWCLTVNNRIERNEICLPTVHFLDFSSHLYLKVSC